jgi:hypothetical protein
MPITKKYLKKIINEEILKQKLLEESFKDKVKKVLISLGLISSGYLGGLSGANQNKTVAQVAAQVQEELPLSASFKEIQKVVQDLGVVEYLEDINIEKAIQINNKITNASTSISNAKFDGNLKDVLNNLETNKFFGKENLEFLKDFCTTLNNESTPWANYIINLEKENPHDVESILKKVGDTVAACVFVDNLLHEASVRNILNPTQDWKIQEELNKYQINMGSIHWVNDDTFKAFKDQYKKMTSKMGKMEVSDEDLELFSSFFKTGLGVSQHGGGGKVANNMEQWYVKESRNRRSSSTKITLSELKQLIRSEIRRSRLG